LQFLISYVKLLLPIFWLQQTNTYLLQIPTIVGMQKLT